MYLRMNVGYYKGEIRGPFHMDAAKALIARGDATPTESLGDGQYRVIEAEPETPAAASMASPAEDGKHTKKARR